MANGLNPEEVRHCARRGFRSRVIDQLPAMACMYALSFLRRCEERALRFAFTELWYCAVPGAWLSECGSFRERKGFEDNTVRENGGGQPRVSDRIGSRVSGHHQSDKIQQRPSQR